MIASQNMKIVPLKTFATVATDATNSAYIDTKGWKYAEFVVVQPSSSNTSVTSKLAALRLCEADDTTTSYTAISGFVGTTNSSATAGSFVIPGVSSTDAQNTNRQIRLGVDLRGRKRYITVESQPHATSNVYFSYVILSRGEEAPDTAAEAGAGAWVKG